MSVSFPFFKTLKTEVSHILMCRASPPRGAGWGSRTPLGSPNILFSTTRLRYDFNISAILPALPDLALAPSDASV